MTVKFSLSYTDGDFIDNIEVPIYKVYRKGTSFQLYHLNRNPARNEHKELLVIDESGITPESMFKSVKEFCEKLSPIYWIGKMSRYFYLGSIMTQRKIRWWTLMILRFPV